MAGSQPITGTVLRLNCRKVRPSGFCFHFFRNASCCCLVIRKWYSFLVDGQKKDALNLHGSCALPHRLIAGEVLKCWGVRGWAWCDTHHAQYTRTGTVRPYFQHILLDFLSELVNRTPCPCWLVRVRTRFLAFVFSIRCVVLDVALVSYYSLYKLPYGKLQIKFRNDHK